MSTETSRKSSTVQWGIAVALFVVVVGTIAWVSQNLPKGPTKPSPVPDGQPAPGGTAVPSGPTPTGHLRFPYIAAIWDEKEPTYAMEYEFGKDGFYVFPFHNPNAFPVTLSFARSSCDCSHLEAVVVDAAAAEKLKAATKPAADPLPGAAFQWVKLTKDDKNGLEVPPDGWGLAKLDWHGRKNPGESLKINVLVSTAPTDSPNDRSFVSLSVPVIVREAVRFLPEKLSLGTIVPAGVERGKLLAWSPTREVFDLKIDAAQTDPLFEVTATKLEPKEAEALRNEMQKTALERVDGAEAIKNLKEYQTKENAATRIRSAYRIDVLVREQLDGKQLDQGHFSRELPVTSKDAPIAPPYVLPTVTAFVRGDVEVGSSEDGKINLKNFPGKTGVSRTIPIFSDGRVDLVFESASPAALEVKLRPNVKDSTPTRRRWLLDVTVPPEAWYGSFQENAVIILRSETTPPRRIRIPVVGVGGHG